MRVNWLDRWLLAGRDPYRPVYLLRVVRLQVAFAVAIVIVLAFNGFLFYSLQQRTHDNCVQRNRSAIVSRQVLDQLVAATHADSDANAEEVWRQWRTVSRQTSLPKC
jgi:hypothetical protein